MQVMEMLLGNEKLPWEGRLIPQVNHQRGG